MADVGDYIAHAQRFGPELVLETASRESWAVGGGVRELALLMKRLEAMEPASGWPRDSRPFRCPATVRTEIARELLSMGESPRSVARMVNVSRTQAYRLLSELRGMQTRCSIGPVSPCVYRGSQSQIADQGIGVGEAAL